jgi:hypothetical protein
MYFVFIYENKRMKPVEIVLRKERRGKRENDGGGKSEICCKHICKYHNVCLKNVHSTCEAEMAHSYNPSFSGGRDQEDHSSKTAPANSSTDPITKLSNTRKGWWSGSSHKVPA